LVTFCLETAIEGNIKGGEKGQEVEEEDVGGYWMTLRKGEKMFSFEGGSSRSRYVESSLWKMLWTCRKTDY
jgi:hypothetical protein